MESTNSKRTNEPWSKFLKRGSNWNVFPPFTKPYFLFYFLWIKSESHTHHLLLLSIKANTFQQKGALDDFSSLNPWKANNNLLAHMSYFHCWPMPTIYCTCVYCNYGVFKNRILNSWPIDLLHLKQFIIAIN